MKIEFNDLIKRKNFTKDLEGTITMESFLYEGDEIIFKSPVKAKGEASVLEDILELNLEVSTDIELTCTRCLDRYTSNINLNISEVYTNDSQKENEDIIFITEDYIDIDKVIIDNILLSLPIKKLCSDNCKGLCQSCGANLNRTTCNCSKEDVDIRLAELKNLFLSD